MKYLSVTKQVNKKIDLTLRDWAKTKTHMARKIRFSQMHNTPVICFSECTHQITDKRFEVAT